MRHLAGSLGLIALAALGQADESTLEQQVDGYRAAHETQIVARLDALTRIRSIAADPAGLTEAAEQLLQMLKQRGFEARLLAAGDSVPPLVLGTFNAPGAKRTVVFYAHYNGQPVTATQWSSDPFVPVMRSGALRSGGTPVDWRSAPPPLNSEWRLFGRAVADDKASIVAFLAAFDALAAAGRKPSVNIKVLWEGEEEAGSAHLEQLLRSNRALLGADLWLIGDGPVHQSRRPLLYFGARGVVGARMIIYGPIKPLHDGHYGNWVPNPAALAADLIAEMRDEKGRILIPGFGDSVRALSPVELEAIRKLPSIDSQLQREFGIAGSEGDEELALSLMRPALNVRGIRSGQVGAAAANAIPVEAEIAIDFRLVPDQTPGSVRTTVERFLRSKGWTIVTAAPDLPTRLAHPHRAAAVGAGLSRSALRHVDTPIAGGDRGRQGRSARSACHHADDGCECADLPVRRGLQGAGRRTADRQSR